ncbi:MAG: OmpA family protein [Granulosicoccus sp.]
MSRFLSVLVLFIVSVVLSPAYAALQNSWHIAIGTGLSVLEPETDGSNLTLEDDQGTVVSVNLGYDVNTLITTELGFTSLGSAALSNNESVDYQAISLGAVAYLVGERESHYRQEGLSAYLRFGVSKMDNESEVRLSKADDAAFWLGAGAQWPLGRSWSLRGELTSFDGDANALIASLVWRNAKTRRARIADVSPVAAPVSTVASVSEPEPVSTAVPQAVRTEKPTPPLAPMPEPKVVSTARVPETTADFARQAAVAPESALAMNTEAARADSGGCYSSPMQASVSQSACAVLNGVLAGVDFKPDTSEITLLGKASLDRVASALKQYPQAVVELRAHTHEYSRAGLADQLSRDRVVNVARYLTTRGVPIRQLRARSFGSQRPIADNSTAVGRRSNNRLEVKLL